MNYFRAVVNIIKTFKTDMKKIGVLSDTHGFFDPKLKHFFGNCDEIWHLGDIGSIKVVEEIRKLKPLRAVYGNIDGQEIRKEFNENERFWCEEVEVWMTHIGGYPRRYNSHVRELIRKKPPGLFISGHSHILKVMYDKDLKLLYINPGAAGKSGMHLVRTAVRFEIRGKEIENLEVIELGKRGK